MRAVALGMQFDHPGLYPRNPVGKGYLVLPDPVDGIELPNLEDPADMLTAERLIARKPALWYRQPLPWCFEWTVGLTFPRYLFMGVDAWFPSPDDSALPEVHRGFIPAHLRRQLEKDHDLAAGYRQEASLGMVLGTPLAGQPVTLTGMHPEEPIITFTVPPAPSIEIEVEGERAVVPPLLDQSGHLFPRKGNSPPSTVPEPRACNGYSFPEFTRTSPSQPASTTTLPSTTNRRLPFTIGYLPPRRRGRNQRRLASTPTEAPAMSSRNLKREPSESASPSEEGDSVFDNLLAAPPRPAWPEGHVIAVCTEERHPTLTGRIHVRCEDARGRVHESWVATLHGLSVRVSDRVLVLKLTNQSDPIVLGVVDGFSRRPELPELVAHVLEMKRDETMQVNAENGQPLLHITRNQQGPVIRLLQADTQVELPGRLCISARAIEMHARAGSVRIDASDDVEIVGEAIHLN